MTVQVDSSQHLAALVNGDEAAMEAMMAGLASAENEQRRQAELAFEQLKCHPDACVSQLLRTLRSSPDMNSRTYAAVLLRRVLTRDDKSLWPALTPSLKETVKGELLNCIKEEQMRSITKKVCDGVSELAAGILEEQGWQQLLPFMFQCIQSNEPRLMESALLIFGQLARYVIDFFTPHLPTLHSVLKTCLAHQDVDVRVAAVMATCAFIQELKESSHRDAFQDTIPLLLQAITHALNSGDEDKAQEALELFIEVAEEHPRFLRRQLNEVLVAFIQMAEEGQLEDSTRQLAAEFLVTLCEAREKAPGMMRKLPMFLDRFFTCLVSFLMDVEDDPAWHSAEDEKDEDEGEGELFPFGQECLDRIAIALGGKTLVPLAGKVLPIMMADAKDWKKRHAALICLAQIAEGCAKVMRQSEVVQQLVAMCLQGVRDPHAKVRWASCQAIGQLCTDLGPELQEEAHSVVVPALLSLMEDFPNPRVQAHACAAIVNFAENSDQDVIAPYLDVLIGRLVALLQQGKRLVQEGALTALASVADCSQEYFDKYYDVVMPLLKTILQQATEPSHRLLRSKAIECLSLIGLAVGKERFGPDAHEVMTYMQHVSAHGIEADDPLVSYFQQAAARVCKVLGSDFIPYLPLVMPSLLASAKAKPDVVVNTDSDQEDHIEGGDEDDEDDEDVETFLLGGRRVSLKTSILEDKATACHMICLLASDLREGFFQYTEEVTKIMVPLLKFIFSDDVRIAAAQCLPELIISSKLAAQKGLGADENFVRAMLNFMWQPLIDALKVEPEPTVIEVFLRSIEEILEAIEGTSLLPVEAVGALFEKLNQQLDDYEERRKERLERTSAEDFDDEEAEALEEEHEAEGDLLDAVGVCISTTMRIYGDAAMPYLEGLMPAASRLLEKSRFPEERRIALCMMDDVLEHSAAGTVKFAGHIMPLLLSGLSDRDANIRQCCVYGLGQAAQKRPDAFRPHAAPAVAGMLAMIQAPDARSEDNENATENAISALGKVLEFQADCVDPTAATLYLNSLPLKEDESEARIVHAQLLRLVQASDPRILGEGNSNLPQIVKVMVQVLSRGDALVEKETAASMATLLKQMQAALPSEVFQGFVSQLKPKQLSTLQTILQ